MIAGEPCSPSTWAAAEGKTKVAIDLIESLSPPPCVLIFCPKAVIGTWLYQFEVHARGTRIYDCSRGNCAKRLEEMQKWYGACLLTNYETIGGPYAKATEEWILSQDWDLVICDEIHRAKAVSGKRSRFLAKLADKAKRRLGLTGTPLPHSPLDAFAEYRFLDRTVFGPYVGPFKERYCILDPKYPSRVLAWKRKEELSALIGSIMYQVKADEVLDLPPAVHSERPVDLLPATRKIYDSLEKDFFAWVRDGLEVTAQNALVKLLRLQQVTSGFVVDGTGCSMPLGGEKELTLTDVLEELPEEEPVVVFCRFRADLDAVRRVCAALWRDWREISGSDHAGLGEWQQGQGTVLIAQIQAGSVGVDLTRARYAVYYSIGFSLAEYEQSLARLRRPGQKAGSVIYTHLVATKTVDVAIRQAIQKRRDLVEYVLAEAKR